MQDVGWSLPSLFICLCFPVWKLLSFELSTFSWLMHRQTHLSKPLWLEVLCEYIKWKYAILSPVISTFHFVKTPTSLKCSSSFIMKSSLPIFRSLSAFPILTLSTHMQPFSISGIVVLYFYVSNLKQSICWQGFGHICIYYLLQVLYVNTNKCQ